jgi:hypothetical protein
MKWRSLIICLKIKRNQIQEALECVAIDLKQHEIPNIIKIGTTRATNQHSQALKDPLCAIFLCQTTGHCHLEHTMLPPAMSSRV